MISRCAVRLLLLVTATAFVSAGCTEVVPGFRGALKLKSESVENSSQLRRSYFSCQESLPNGRRLLVLDCYDVPAMDCVAVVVLVAEEPVRGKVRITGQPNARAKAWIVDPGKITACGEDDFWANALQRYCRQLATKSDGEQQGATAATELTGRVNFGDHVPAIPADYDIKVSLRSERSGVSVNGEYKRFVVVHPEYPFLEVFGLVYFLTTGKLPI